MAGLALLWVAIASPLDAFSGLLLSAHMIQHLLLLSVAPPLILLGAPFLPLLRGLPRKFARDGVGPFLTWPALQRVASALTHPVCCWMVMTATLFVWHAPPVYDLALRSPGWHKAEHACFVAASLLFWWPVVRPFPSRPRWPLWSVPIYLLAADLSNTILSAILTFSDHVLYSPYLEPRRGYFGTTALGDQSCAGVIMWVPGSLIFLIPAALTAIQYLSPGHSLVRPEMLRSKVDLRSSAAMAVPRFGAVKRRRSSSAKPFDLSDCAVIGPFLRAAARPSFHANSPLHRCRCGHAGRTARSASQLHESCWCAALDLLAGLRRDRSAGGGQFLLHGLSLHAVPRVGKAPPFASNVPGRGLCAQNGSALGCWWCFSGPTKCLDLWDKPAGPRG